MWFPQARNIGLILKTELSPKYQVYNFLEELKEKKSTDNSNG